MRKRLPTLGILVGACLLSPIIFCLPQASHAQEDCEPPSGRFASIEGTVEVQHVEGGDWRAAAPEHRLCKGDTIRVGDRSRAAVYLANEAVMRLDQNTTMRLLDISAEPEERSLLEVLKGALQSFSRKPRLLSVNTPYLNGLIEGTEFLVRVEADRASLGVLDGRVAVENAHGQTKVASGELATAQAGKPPTLQTVVRPRDAVQWALYYPPVLSDSGKAAEQVPPSLRTALEAARQGDTAGAFGALDRVPEGERDPRFYQYRAALLLNVGRVEEARADIDRALARDPNASLGYALRSVINVVQNNREQGLVDGQRAVKIAPDSATALIALSYAQQAQFQLEQARDTLRQAVEKEPGNALAWARLAELDASFGELDDALKAAQTAVSLEPNLSRTQTVLGFAYLMQVKTKEAKETFQKAIALGQADPLPRLGLGLAKIREGDLQEGRQEIELATGLDPNNSLIRSYLGKAYYEEKRTELTDPQYTVAKELDPNDPTPYFYDAIEKQTTNRPVEALQDLQKAIELNDNRAVYRSKLLLDSDLAARSASLGRVYTDLGFQQLALVEGWKSVNTDPSNYSAHRFLADSYAVLPRHGIARVSELFQSQMLQPLNTTPIQPRLAESNLFLISAGGPGALSFNEFNPIFNRDGVTLQASGIVGEDDTYGGEGVVSGIYKNASFSAGYSHFETDGVRENYDLTDDIVNALVQVELTHTTSIQAEFRDREVDRGDTQTRFLPEDISRTARFERDSDLLRLGARHAISPSNILLVSAMHANFDETQRDEQFPAFFFGVGDFTQFIPSEAWGGEMQHLFRSRYFDLTSGVGYFNVDSEIAINFKGFIPPPDGPGPFELDVFTDRSLEHFNAYTYGEIKPLSNLTLTLGGSYDRITGDSASVPDGGETDQLNPKFGVIWNPLPATTIRGAAFRVFKRTLVADQTLEPTQVGGFNQFFDDFDATDAWRYGVGIDQKLTRQLFGGVEYSRRELEIPLIDFTGDDPRTTGEPGDEDLVRAYLNWVPHPWLAFNVDYFYEQFENDETFAFGQAPVSLETHRVPIGLRLFHPSGMSLGFSSTYVNQEGEFLPQGASDTRTGSDTFWLLDASISYRLPKRYGFISLGVANITDEEFRYFEVDEENQFINPGRSIAARLTLAFP